MDSTSVNLLRRLRQFDDQAAWQRFLDLYSKLIFYWLRKSGLGVDDSADLLQDILLTVVRRIREFEYDPGQKFRGWLRTITTNRVIDFQRRDSNQRQTPLTSADSASLAALSEDFLGEDEYRQMLLSRALECLKADFSDPVWQAAYLQLVEGQPARLVAEKLGLSCNSVYLAKSRVLAKLRQELSGLID